VKIRNKIRFFAEPKEFFPIFALLFVKEKIRTQKWTITISTILKIREKCLKNSQEKK
jgi:hypothetical protein